jgi:DNA-binding FrmR family transcriptional regulator
VAESENTPASAAGYVTSGEKGQILTRLRRVEGQVRGIAGMVEDDRYCIDVLQQISAAQAALDKAALALVDGHTRHCIADAEPAERAAKHDELMTAVERLITRR